MAIGLSPIEVDKLSLWQLDAAIAGWNRVHGAKQAMAPPTDEEFDMAVLRSAD